MALLLVWPKTLVKNDGISSALNYPYAPSRHESYTRGVQAFARAKVRASHCTCRSAPQVSTPPCCCIRRIFCSMDDCTWLIPLGAIHTHVAPSLGCTSRTAAGSGVRAAASLPPTSHRRLSSSGIGFIIRGQQDWRGRGASPPAGDSAVVSTVSQACARILRVRERGSAPARAGPTRCAGARMMPVRSARDYDLSR